MLRMIIVGLVICFVFLWPKNKSDIPKENYIMDKMVQKDVKCLAANMHFEARGESEKGKIAVGFVTLNRVSDKRFPKSICKVVKQPGQFSWVADHLDFEKIKIPNSTMKLARSILENKYQDVTNGALFFHNDTVEAFERRFITKIGNHFFYK